MFTRRAVLIVLVLASITLAQSARGQVSSPGYRVRIMESHSRRPLIVGWLVRQTIDSVVIVPDSLLSQGTERVFVLGRQHRLEQSAGLRRRTLRGMRTGLLVGAAGGGILGASTWACPPDSLICFSRGISAAAGAVLLALPGLLVGGIVGGQKTHEAWRPIGDRGVRVAIAPTAKRGVQLTATTSF